MFHHSDRHPFLNKICRESPHVPIEDVRALLLYMSNYKYPIRKLIDPSSGKLIHHTQQLCDQNMSSSHYKKWVVVGMILVASILLYRNGIPIDTILQGMRQFTNLALYRLKSVITSKDILPSSTTIPSLETDLNTMTSLPSTTPSFTSSFVTSSPSPSDVVDKTLVEFPWTKTFLATSAASAALALSLLHNGQLVHQKPPTLFYYIQKLKKNPRLIDGEENPLFLPVFRETLAFLEPRRQYYNEGRILAEGSSYHKHFLQGTEAHKQNPSEDNDEHIVEECEDLFKKCMGISYEDYEKLQKGIEDHDVGEILKTKFEENYYSFTQADCLYFRYLKKYKKPIDHSEHKQNNQAIRKCIHCLNSKTSFYQFNKCLTQLIMDNDPFVKGQPREYAFDDDEDMIYILKEYLLGHIQEQEWENKWKNGFLKYRGRNFEARSSYTMSDIFGILPRHRGREFYVKGTLLPIQSILTYIKWGCILPDSPELIQNAENFLYIIRGTTIQSCLDNNKTWIKNMYNLYLYLYGDYNYSKLQLMRRLREVPSIPFTLKVCDPQQETVTMGNIFLRIRSLEKKIHDVFRSFDILTLKEWRPETTIPYMMWIYQDLYIYTKKNKRTANLLGQYSPTDDWIFILPDDTSESEAIIQDIHNQQLRVSTDLQNPLSQQIFNTLEKNRTPIHSGGGKMLKISQYQEFIESLMNTQGFLPGVCVLLVLFLMKTDILMKAGIRLQSVFPRMKQHIMEDESNFVVPQKDPTRISPGDMEFIVHEFAKKYPECNAMFFITPKGTLRQSIYHIRYAIHRYTLRSKIHRVQEEYLQLLEDLTQTIMTRRTKSKTKRNKYEHEKKKKKSRSLN